MSPFDKANELATEYIPQPEFSAHVKEGYWKAAFGLQAVDGLAPSRYARRLADEHIRGTATLADVMQQLGTYYSSNSKNHDQAQTEEADKVSARIVELLSTPAFSLDWELLPQIHRHLFQDLDASVYHPGALRTEPLVKLEAVLNGDTLLYGAPSLIARSLEVLFSKERDYRYATYSDGGTGLCYADLAHFVGFVSDVWFTHPFWEGNTRTVAVFCELYLNYLGFNVNNEPFEKGSAFFRNALVRANYRNRAAGVDVDFTPLTTFFSNVLGDGDEPLRDEDVYCKPLFARPELVRNVDHAFAMPYQEELKRMGITETVLAKPE